MAILYWLFLIVYSVIITLLIPFFFLAQKFAPKLQKQVMHRFLVFLPPDLKNFSKKSKTCLFFCSSAGEYEQAKPLITRCERLGYQPVLLFFSESGRYFAERLGETAKYWLVPPDTIWHWYLWLRKIKPRAIFIVRHELWPSFLEVAKCFAPVNVVNVEFNPQKKMLRKKLVATLLAKVAKIFVVSSDDEDLLLQIEPQLVSKISVVGDTKYDRVYERSRDNNKKTVWFQPEPEWLRRPKIVIGSAWLADVAVLGQAFRKIAGESPEWLLCVVPHDLSPGNLLKIEAQLVQLELQPKTLRENFNFILSEPGPHALIIDRMGMLAELYRHAQLAFIGGGFHHRVHNVLEPSVYGVPVACGPRYEFSPEAKLLVKDGLLRVMQNSQDLVQWWREWQKRPEFHDGRLVAKLNSLYGASDKIISAAVTEEK